MRVLQFLAAEDAQDIAEYAMLISVLAAVIIIIVSGMTSGIADMFTSFASRVIDAVGW
jgi:Flp pilus assembly pilin Flp